MRTFDSLGVEIDDNDLGSETTKENERSKLKWRKKLEKQINKTITNFVIAFWFVVGSLFKWRGIFFEILPKFSN